MLHTRFRNLVEVAGLSGCRSLRPLQSLQQFLEHGGEVLRFYLLWDIPAEQGGGRARFKMHYFVADSTVS